MRLTDKSQLGTLHTILLRAFTAISFESMLLSQLKIQVTQITPMNTSHSENVLEVITYYNDHDRIQDLITAAYQAKPKDETLVNFAYSYNQTSPNREQLELERNTREANPYFNGKQYREAWAQCEGCICLIQLPNGDTGTGILLADNLVMTNYHVMERVHLGKDTKQHVKVIFDYTTLDDGRTTTPGTTYFLADDWLVDYSVGSDLDKISEPTASPELDQLDYALIRLKGTPGTDVVNAGNNQYLQSKQRGWLTPYEGEYQFTVNAPLTIVQHPKGSSLRTAIDSTSIIGINANRTRIRYRTNTEKGSSGSPCFDSGWRLIALHHAGDPIYSALHRAEFNQGIPFEAIINLLKKRNKYYLISTKYVRTQLPPPQITQPAIILENLRPVFLTSIADQLYGDWLRSFTDTEGIMPISLRMAYSKTHWNRQLMMILGRCKAGIVMLSQETSPIRENSELVAELWLMWWLYWRTNGDFMPIIVCLDEMGEQLLEQPPLNQLGFASNQVIRGQTDIQSIILERLNENSRQRMPFETLVDEIAAIVGRTADTSDLRTNLRLVLKPEVTFLPKDRLMPLLDNIQTDQSQWQSLVLQATNDLKTSICSIDEAITRMFSFELLFQGVTAGKSFQNFKWKATQVAHKQNLSLYGLLATLSIDPIAASLLAHITTRTDKAQRVFRINTYYPEVATLYIERAYFEYFEGDHGGLRWMISPQGFSTRHSWRVIPITMGGPYQEDALENAIREIYAQLTNQTSTDNLLTVRNLIKEQLADDDHIILLMQSSSNDQEFVEALLNMIDGQFSLCLIDSKTVSTQMDAYNYLDPRLEEHLETELYEHLADFQKRLKGNRGYGR